jgi:pyruvate dehydrogenase E2 component (dihydrolipoamide acetyltransferase)
LWSLSMATSILLPKFGNSVESSIIVRWIKQIGDLVVVGEALCEVETDKATMEVPSPVAGILIEQLAAVGDDVPVQKPIAIIASESDPKDPVRADRRVRPDHEQPISPRARNLAARTGIDIAQLSGSGPGGRIIERDIQAAMAAQPKLTPLAKSMLSKGGFVAPASGSGPGGRVNSKDLREASEPMPAPSEPAITPAHDEITSIPLSGIRRVIADRMLASLQTTAQLTLNRTVDARQLQALRKRLKASPEALGVRDITLNDLLLFAVARSLPLHAALNAILREQTIEQYRHVHLGLAVDTPRGLMVPVIRQAETLSLRALAGQAHHAAEACLSGKASPDLLSGGTFTVSNLGNLGIESFTPVLNVPQVAILGVGAVALKPIETASGIEFIPHLHLSLTINHQVVDGAPAARFLQQLAEYIANLDLVIAL